MPQLIIIVAMLALMWLLLIRPQRRRQAEQARMLAALSVGDEIITAEGFYGEVRPLGDDELTVEIAPGVEVRVAKRAVAAIVPPEDELEEADEGEFEEAPDEVGARADSASGEDNRR